MNMNKPLIKFGCLIVGLLLFSGMQAKPNVLLILTDDQGYGDLSLHGNPVLRTPAMDSIGKDGVRLDRFYVSPLCAPTRASLLTGRYHLRTGTFGVSHRQEVINPEEKTIAEVFKDGGYATGCFGKWHNGAIYPETPLGQGFDEFFGFLGGVWFEYYDPVLMHNETEKRYKGYITDLLTDKAIDWMDDQIDNEEPFFCYLPYNTPHTPGLVDKRYWEPFYKKQVGRWESVIYGMIKDIDDDIARILKFLDKKGQAENTIVIFMTDNGPNTFRYTAGLRGKKAQIHDGGTRVPCFIRWPGQLQPHRISQPLSHIDILPTLAELCDIPVSGTKELDGQSFVSLLRNPGHALPDRRIISFHSVNEQRIRTEAAVHTNRWSAIQNRGKWALYDMQDDVRQLDDVSGQFPEVLEELRSHWVDTLAEMPNLGVETPVPVGSSEKVILKGHDANFSVARGKGIDLNYRSSFTGLWISKWTDKNVYPEWNLQINRPGKYKVSLLYCLAEENLGVQAHLDIQGKKLPLKITKAFDPPSNEQPFWLDGESEKYESKPWKTIPLGEVSLKPGSANARIHVTKLPGKAAMEVKEIVLERL